MLLNNFSRYIACTVILVLTLTSALFYNLDKISKLGFANTLSEDITVTARVCRTIEDSRPSINPITSGQCNIVSWTGVDNIFGYPSCQFTENPVYILQISTTADFSNIVFTTNTPLNAITISGLIQSNNYYYRVRVFDPDRPDFLSAWSEVETCSGGFRPPLISRPSITSGSKPNPEITLPERPVIFNRITKFDEACLKPERSYIQTFPDLGEQHQAYEILNKFYRFNILDGYTDNTIRPDRLITRAEAIKIILNIPCEPLIYPAQFQLYSDTTLNQWYSDYVWTATILGIVSGYENTSLFGPHNYSTRAEALKMVLNSLLPRDEVNKSYYQYATNTYLDVSSRDWYYRFVNFAFHNKIGFGSTRNMFRPNHYITRAEFVSIINDTVDYNWHDQ